MTQTLASHGNAMLCQPVTWSGYAEWPQVADAVIEALVRMLADCVETAEVLQYQPGGSHVCSMCFASTPHTCWLNCDSSDTVGFTPHICKGNHVEGCKAAVCLTLYSAVAGTARCSPGLSQTNKPVAHWRLTSPPDARRSDRTLPHVMSALR